MKVNANQIEYLINLAESLPDGFSANEKTIEEIITYILTNLGKLSKLLQNVSYTEINTLASTSAFNSNGHYIGQSYVITNATVSNHRILVTSNSESTITGSAFNITTGLYGTYVIATNIFEPVAALISILNEDGTLIYKVSSLTPVGDIEILSDGTIFVPPKEKLLTNEDLLADVAANLIKPGYLYRVLDAVANTRVIKLWGLTSNSFSSLQWNETTAKLTTYNIVSNTTIDTVGGFIPSGNTTQILQGDGTPLSKIALPISTATQDALNLKANASGLSTHIADTNNPHAVTKAQVGLGNADNTSDTNKPVSTAQAAAITAAITALKDGVSTSGDTLQKLYNLILGAVTQITVANIAARDAYNVPRIPFNIFVTDDGDTKWALYAATTTGVGATFVKLSDPDLLNAVMTAAQIKTAYESNSDTNAFTNALLAKLNAISGTNTGDETAARIGAIVNGAASYTTPQDSDKIGIWDFANGLFKSVTWAVIKFTLKTYFDSFYQNALGFTPEDIANKTDIMSGNTTSSIKFLSAKGVYNWVTGLGYQLVLTAANFGAFLSGLSAKSTPLSTEYIIIGDSAASGDAKKVLLSSLPVSTPVSNALALKENAITAGSTAQYIRGDKTLATLATDVRAAALLGLVFTNASQLLASDNILAAFGKLQAQANLANVYYADDSNEFVNQLTSTSTPNYIGGGGLVYIIAGAAAWTAASLVGLTDGIPLYIKNTTGTTWVVTAPTGYTIDGAATITLAVNEGVLLKARSLLSLVSVLNRQST
jgi:hypothetical protein